MGAELYIERIQRPLLHRYQPLFLAALQKRNQAPAGSKAAATAQAELEHYGALMQSKGYFRDNYNATSVLWRLGLSWWDDVMPLCDEQGKLNGPALVKFRQMVRDAKLTPPTRPELEAQGLRVAKADKYSVAGWQTYFQKAHARLMAFLDDAIARDSAVVCWL